MDYMQHHIIRIKYSNCHFKKQHTPFFTPKSDTSFCDKLLPGASHTKLCFTNKIPILTSTVLDFLACCKNYLLHTPPILPDKKEYFVPLVSK